jgi:autoinducer 2-binding protein LuxP
VFYSFVFASEEYIFVDEYYKNGSYKQKHFQSFAKSVRQYGVDKLKDNNTKIKIYMVYPGNQVSDYWRRSKDSFEKRLKELGINYELIDYFTKPNIQISQQAKALFKSLHDNTDYLIFTLDVKKHTKFIENILQRQKPKLILQNITTPLKKFDKQPFLYVGFDHTIGTKILANEYINQMPKNANYAILYGTNGYVSKMRGDYFKTYVEQNSNFKLLDSYYTDFDKDRAKLATLDLLKNHKKIDFIYACSTDIALGVIEVLKEKKLIGKIKVNGWGGGSSELDAILDGSMDFTVMRMNDDNGVAMAEAIKLDLQKKSQDVPLIYSGDFELVKKGITQDRLDLLKQKAFRYSGY